MYSPWVSGIPPSEAIGQPPDMGCRNAQVCQCRPTARDKHITRRVHDADTGPCHPMLDSGLCDNINIHLWLRNTQMAKHSFAASRSCKVVEMGC